MELWVANYEILGRRARKELLVEVATGNDPGRTVAEAILRHEFAEVYLHFGKTVDEPPATTLYRFSIVNLSYGPVTEQAVSSKR